MTSKHLIGLLVLTVTACAKPPAQPVPELDAQLLDDHLAAATARLTELDHAVEVARQQGLIWDPAAEKFSRLIWSGDAADLCMAIQAKTGLRCRIAGKRAWVLPVSISGRNLSVDDVLRDAGAQLGARADFIFSSKEVTLEYKIPQ